MTYSIEFLFANQEGKTMEMEYAIGDIIGFVALIIALIALFRDLLSNKKEREHRKKIEFIGRIEWMFEESRHQWNLKTMKYSGQIGGLYIIEIERPPKIDAGFFLKYVKNNIDIIVEEYDLDIIYTANNKSLHIRVRTPKRRFFGILKGIREDVVRIHN